MVGVLVDRLLFASVNVDKGWLRFLQLIFCIMSLFLHRFRVLTSRVDLASQILVNYRSRFISEQCEQCEQGRKAENF